MEKIGRRNFLKLCGGTAGILTLGKAANEVAQASVRPGENVSRATRRFRQSTPTTCQLCHARCGVICFVEDARVVKIEGNPEHPGNRGKICAKGQAGINLAYNPDRILYPLKRVGKRGEGKWEKISWDEALSLISQKMTTIRDSGSPEAFVFQAGTMATSPLVARFVKAFGTPNGFASIPNSDTNRLIALNQTWGEMEEVSDLANSKYILNFGANPYETYRYHLPVAQRLIEGRTNNRAKLVTFDVRLSQTAGRSDEWFPINPGTDGLVALAMANIIMQENLHDGEFIDRWCNYSQDDLKAHLGQYTPGMAAFMSGIAEEDIIRLAREFASTKPATTISGAGVSMRHNGLQSVRSIFLLNAITGNIDSRGGYCMPRYFPAKEAGPEPPGNDIAGGLASTDNFPFNSKTLSHSILKLIQDQQRPVELLMTYMFNPAYSNAANRQEAEVLKDEGLIRLSVVVDIFMTETAALADIVLPDVTYLERWGIETGPAMGMVPYLALRQPVINPLGEARSFEDVCIDLAKKIGGMDEYFKFRTSESYYKQVILESLASEGIGGWEDLKTHGVLSKGGSPVYKSYAARGFSTKSGKLELFSDSLAKAGMSPLPDWENVPGYEKEDNEALYFVTFKWNVLTSFTAPSKWLSEIVHDDALWMNVKTAEELGIGKGDNIKIIGPAGEIETKVRLTQGINPNVVAMSGQAGHWEMGRVARAEKFISDDPDTRFVWWGRHGNGVHPNSIMAASISPVTGAQIWHDNKVKVVKV
ncbi:MAG: molybdopterin-dependent oxidoreductase [Dehalococcoidia bacterium]|nr:molybdopterin-dependent oxidoreductase [Dehalococcoidia bacterium]